MDTIKEITLLKGGQIEKWKVLSFYNNLLDKLEVEYKESALWHSFNKTYPSTMNASDLIKWKANSLREYIKRIEKMDDMINCDELI